MMTRHSLREVIDRGVELRHYEAVAVAQQLIASLDIHVAAEIYDRRLKDRDRARATYRRVPPMSSHFNEAQKRLR